MTRHVDYNAYRDTEERRKIPLKWHFILSLGMLTCAVIPAVLVEDISKIFTVLGATTNPVICFILPALFVVKAVPDEEMFCTKVAAVIVAIVVPSISGFSLAYQISLW